MIDHKPPLFVTAYYPGPAKHAEEQYLQWARRLFRSAPGEIVCFVPDEQIQTLMRSTALARNVEFCVLPFMQLPAIRMVGDWRAQIALDPERARHGNSTHLYVVWNSKTFLVQRALVDRSGSRAAFWIDVGYVRSVLTEMQLRGCARRLSRESSDASKMHLLSLKPFDREEVAAAATTHPDKFNGKVRLGGGMYGGHVSAWEKWAVAYEGALRMHAGDGCFVGKDQNIMATIALQHSGLCALWSASRERGDPWFSLPRAIGRV